MRVRLAGRWFVVVRVAETAWVDHGVVVDCGARVPPYVLDFSDIFWRGTLTDRRGRIGMLVGRFSWMMAMFNYRPALTPGDTWFFSVNRSERRGNDLIRDLRMNNAPSPSAPQQDPDPRMADWAEALEARGRPAQVRTEDWTRRRLALIGIVIALLFPFYQHAVQRELARRELQELERAAEAAMRDAGQAAAASARQAQAQRAARGLQARLAVVRVVGVIDGNPPIAVVENLPPEGAAEAADYICAQAGAWLRRSVGGIPLQVTRDGGDRPGTDAGRILCPPG
jgi:type II secretory pathway pseudopilin PulG